MNKNQIVVITGASAGLGRATAIEFANPQPAPYIAEVSYLGVVYATLSALRRMTPRNAGTILQVGSALAYRSISLQAAYCASKHGILGFTGSLRCEEFTG